MDFDFREIKAKTILVSCRIPGIDYVINPYTGCRFACKYCYASFMGRFIGKRVEDWGSYVYAKINAPELLKKELMKKNSPKGRLTFGQKGTHKEIFLSSVTDPYQGVEAKYWLTRRCLQILVDFDYQGSVSILTKSDLVLRDIDLFSKLKNISIGLTVTSTDDGISRYFEKFAPPVSARFKALKILNKNNIQTYAFIGPLLPHFVSNPKELEKIFKKLVDVGTHDIFVEHLNLSSYIKGRLNDEMKSVDKEIVKKFYSSQSKSYRQELDIIINELVKKYRMDLHTGGTIFHKEYRKQEK